jgi:hypothetical protein
MWNTIVEIVLGAVLAIIVTILIESLRKPKLDLSIDSPYDYEYLNHPAKKVRFLNLKITNKPLPKIAAWMTRDTATQCHGQITFHHLDGQNVFGRAMQIRWSGTPEPVPMQFRIDNKMIQVFDPSKFSFSSRIDINPGESEGCGIIAKYDEEDDCFGWNNESYISDPIWRNPDWKLPRGRYDINVTIISSGEKITKSFRLINDVQRSDFRLENKIYDVKKRR